MPLSQSVSQDKILLGGKTFLSFEARNNLKGGVR